jgi:hypothetical protein
MLIRNNFFNLSTKKAVFINSLFLFYKVVILPHTKSIVWQTNIKKSNQSGFKKIALKVTDTYYFNGFCCYSNTVI